MRKYTGFSVGLWVAVGLIWSLGFLAHGLTDGEWVMGDAVAGLFAFYIAFLLDGARQ